MISADDPDTSRTLEQIEGDRWGDPPTDASYLVRRCHALRWVPLDQLRVEDLRLLLGQSIGVPTLVPLALHVLVNEPLAEGDFYPGDLLASVLRLDDGHWGAHPEERVTLAEIISKVDPTHGEIAVTELPELVEAFCGRWSLGDSNP